MITTVARSTTLFAMVVLLLFATAPAHAQSGYRLAGGVGSGQPVEAGLAVSQAVIGDGTATAVVLGRSDNFADNLGGAVLARTTDGPLLLNPTDQLDSRVLGEIGRVLPAAQADCNDLASRGEAEVYILGGEAAISQSVENELGGSFCVKRLAGDSRVETSIQVAVQVETLLMNQGRLTDYEYLISRADNAVDSATGGAYGGIFGVPILVTPSGSLHPAVESYLAAGSDAVTLLGGTAALSQTVEDQIRQATPNASVDRLAGASRDDTARLIAEDFAARNGGISDVTLVNGHVEDSWVFALISAAVNPGEPVLYVTTDDLLQPTRSFIQGHAPLTGVTAFGDTSLISDRTIDEAVAAAS